MQLSTPLSVTLKTPFIKNKVILVPNCGFFVCGPKTTCARLPPGHTSDGPKTATVKKKNKKPLKAFPYIYTEDPNYLHGAHKPVGLVAMSSYILASAMELSTSAITNQHNYDFLWTPVIAGAVLGMCFAFLNNFSDLSQYSSWNIPKKSLNVVITGSTRGLGKQLALEFLSAGDNVIIVSRSHSDAVNVARQLLHLRRSTSNTGTVVGIGCDVSDPVSVDRLVSEAMKIFGGTIDVWVNNAGYSGGFKPFIEQSQAVLENIVKTNLLGTLLCQHAAMQAMMRQPNGGHIFNTEGAGSDGLGTPNYAAYGATKAGVAQLCNTMQYESKHTKVRIHRISPGMVLTDLLLSGNHTLKNKQAFDILCEYPETVAKFLVPRMRHVVACRGRPSGKTIRYLTPMRALARFATAPFRLGRFFDRHGNPLFLGEEERFDALIATTTATTTSGNKTDYQTKTNNHSRRRTHHAYTSLYFGSRLGVAYGASIAGAYFVLAMDQIAKAAL